MPPSILEPISAAPSISSSSPETPTTTCANFCPSGTAPPSTPIAAAVCQSAGGHGRGWLIPHRWSFLSYGQSLATALGNANPHRPPTRHNGISLPKPDGTYNPKSYGCRACNLSCLHSSPDCGCLTGVPLGQSPSLHSLRQGQALFVRLLLRYYGFVRFLICVHIYRSVSTLINRLDVPIEHRWDLPGSVQRTSPHAWGLRLREVWCPAGQYAWTNVAFSSTERNQHLEVRPISQLNTQPMVSSVNASRLPSQVTAHHSGSRRWARPYLVEDFHFLSIASLSWRTQVHALG